MKHKMLVPVALGLTLVGTPVLAASQDQPDSSRTFGERVKILFGWGEDARETPPAPPAQYSADPREQAKDESAKPVQTFNDVEIDLEALGTDSMGGED